MINCIRDETKAISYVVINIEIIFQWGSIQSVSKFHESYSKHCILRSVELLHFIKFHAKFVIATTFDGCQRVENLMRYG